MNDPRMRIPKWLIIALAILLVVFFAYGFAQPPDCTGHCATLSGSSRSAYQLSGRLGEGTKWAVLLGIPVGTILIGIAWLAAKVRGPR